MEFMQTVAFLGLGFIGLIVLGIALVALWRASSDQPVLLHAMLRSQGDHVARVATASGSRDFAVAVKQCLRCPATARCRAWLDSDTKGGFEAFCGNAGYVSRIRGLVAFAGRARWT
jgi:hypothetical protein